MVEAITGTGGVRRNALERCSMLYAVCGRRAAGGGQLWCDRIRIAEAGRMVMVVACRCIYFVVIAAALLPQEFFT